MNESREVGEKEPRLRNRDELSPARSGVGGLRRSEHRDKSWRQREVESARLLSPGWLLLQTVSKAQNTHEYTKGARPIPKQRMEEEEEYH